MKNQKNPEITNLIDRTAIALYGMTPAEAIQKGVCIQCKQRITNESFYSAAGQHEYLITALCEHCYDSIFDSD